MSLNELPCVHGQQDARPVIAVRPGGLGALAATLRPAQRRFVEQSGFVGQPQELVLLGSDEGVSGAVLGLGDDRSPNAFGDLAFRLPKGAWRLQPGDFDLPDAVLGYCLGAYRYTGFKQPKREPATLAIPDGCESVLSQASSIWFVRDLINAPANLLGPRQLADAAMELAERHQAPAVRVTGDALTREYPTIAAVGRGSERAPEMVKFTWQGSRATDTSPLVSLCGKGVCFDTGGYDIKPSAGMLRMKKDMGGAATVLGIARTLMQADATLRLEVRIGCVENSVSGTAMRPLDVLRTRRGHNVEIGNTDAEGRLVLCDLLADASDAKPDILIDCATLTGAARVALGPDLPALFCNDDAWAAAFLEAGTTVHDPMWRLPLWTGYDSWLDSNIADFNNVSAKPMAGAVTAALFMRRFVEPGVNWAHFDLYAWNDTSRPARPEGGEAQVLRAVCSAITTRFSLNAAHVSAVT